MKIFVMMMTFEAKEDFIEKHGVMFLENIGVEVEKATERFNEFSCDEDCVELISKKLI